MEILRTPETLLIALLYSIGKLTINENSFNEKIFQEAETTLLFSEFEKNKYHVSHVLSDALTNLIRSGSVVREGLSKYFRASPHTIGLFGKRVFEKEYSKKEQQEIKRLASLIKKDAQKH